MRVLTHYCCLLVAAISLTGCAVDSAHIQIIERPNTVETRKYQETFDEAYYDMSPSGRLRLAFRRHQPASEQGDELTQTIVVESVWHPIPGVTTASQTQINGMVTYGLSGRKIVQNLAGAGAVFYYENDSHDRLTGTLAHVTLESTSSSQEGSLLQRVELSGDFSARRDPRQALRLANDFKRAKQPALARKSK